MRQRFNKIGFYLMSGMQQQVPKIARFIIEQKPTVYTSHDLTRLTSDTRQILRNPLNDIIMRLLNEDTLGEFFAVIDAPKATNIPEMLTTPSITVDIKHHEGLAPLNSFPDYKNKVLVNGTSFLKHDRNYNTVNIGAIDVFQNQIVRGFLSARYEDTDQWLSPYLSEYLIKTYSTVLSGLVAKYYALTEYVDIQRVNAIFALYFSQLLSGDYDSLEMPPIFNRCTYIGSQAELKELAALFADKSRMGLNLHSVSELIATTGPDRMSSFNISTLYTLCGNLGPDQISSRIALEYPPYWAHMIIASLSGNKIPIIFQMNQHRLAQEGKTKFLHQLTSAAIYNYKR